MNEPSELNPSAKPDARGAHGANDQQHSENPSPIVTRLVSMETQVGEHVIHALRQPGTVAVLTTVVPARDGSQHLVSVGLDETLLYEVRHVLSQADADELPHVPCVGFHCFEGDDAQQTPQQP